MFPFYSPENKKTNDFWCFQGTWNGNIGQKWVNDNLRKVGWKRKNADVICYKLPLVLLLQENVKKSKKSMKIANIYTLLTKKSSLSSQRLVEIKWIFQMWFMIILKVTKKQGFTFFLGDTFLEKNTGGRG